MRVVYIAGPFRAPSAWAVECNIRRAEVLALEAWRLGFAVICPHTNTRFFDGAADDSIWLKGDLVLLERCDGILMTPDWANSSGAKAEHRHATANGVQVFYDLAALAEWGPVH